MNLITRSEAKASGLVRYFTGKPCKYGHVADRFVSTLACSECGKAKIKQWRVENADHVRAKGARYRAEHQQYFADWRKNNVDRANALSRDWYSKNKERRLKRSKDWNNSHPAERRVLAHRCRARAVNAEGTFIAQDLARILEQQQYRCAGCANDIAAKRHIDHKVPLSRGGSNWPDNIQLLCPPCNVSKGTATMDEWMNKRKGV